MARKAGIVETQPRKAGGGRKPKAEAEKAEQLTVTLPPDVLAFLTERGEQMGLTPSKMLALLADEARLKVANPSRYFAGREETLFPQPSVVYPGNAQRFQIWGEPDFDAYVIGCDDPRRPWIEATLSIPPDEPVSHS